MKHARAVEELHHFRCMKCGKWWSIGDAPRRRQTWFCPWCGEKNSYLSAVKRAAGRKK